LRAKQKQGKCSRDLGDPNNCCTPQSAHISNTSQIQIEDGWQVEAVVDPTPEPVDSLQKCRCASAPGLPARSEPDALSHASIRMFPFVEFLLQY